MRAYLLRNLQVLLSSLGQFARAPGSSAMSISVIGITLALPTLLYLLVANAERVSSEWHGATHISLFLRPQVSLEEARALASTLRGRDAVEQVRIVDSEQALLEFKELSGFGDALNALPTNPLPNMLVITPNAAHQQPGPLQGLVNDLQALEDVELAQLDLEWVQRFQTILKIIRRALWALSVLLALAVLLIVSNTIRLAILSRREEIEVIQLIGGTARFIRRPFFYSGMLQGLFGAGVAIVLVALCLGLLKSPVQTLADLYGSGFRLSGLGALEALILLAVGAGLGGLASRLSVSRHLRQILPGE